MTGAPHVDSGFLDFAGTARRRRPAGARTVTANGWMSPSLEGALAVNFGKVLERWSAGRIKATEHRVIGSGEARMSSPFLLRGARGRRDPAAAHGCGRCVRAVPVWRLSVGHHHPVRRIQGHGRPAQAAAGATVRAEPRAAAKLERLAFDPIKTLMPIRRRFLSPVWLVPVASVVPRLALAARVSPGPPWGIGVGVARPHRCLRLDSDRSVRRRDRSAWVGLIAMGFFSTLFVMTLLRDVVLLCARIVFGAGAYAALVDPRPSTRWSLTAVIHAGRLPPRAPAASGARRHSHRAAPAVSARLRHRSDQRRARRPDHPPRLRRALGRARE